MTVAAIGGAVGAPMLLRGGADETAAAVEPVPVETRAKPIPPGLSAATDDVRRLFGPLCDGRALSTHWQVDGVHAVRAGAVPVVMSTIYGGRFAVEIFRADPSGPPPVARAGELAVHIVNHGDGSSSTAELAGLGAMALGRELEARLAGGASAPAGLMTYRERMASDPNGTFDIPLV